MYSYLFQYLGDWYTQQVIYASYVLPTDSCSRAQYGSFDNGTVSVYNIGTTISGTFDQACGWAAQADPEGPPGELEVNFGGFGGPYWVLDTDYESFAAVYSCLDGPIGAVKNENAFILTRDTFPSDETVSCNLLSCSTEYLTLEIPSR